MTGKINEANIAEAEKETLAIASNTLSALESAIATWEATKEKPEKLMTKFKKYAWLKESLAGWMTIMLQSKDNNDDFKTREKRLIDFVFICREYKKVS